MTPTPQKVRRQRRGLLATVIVVLCTALALASVFVCSWLWEFLIGH